MQLTSCQIKSVDLNLDSLSNLCRFSLSFSQPKYIQRLKAIRATLIRSDFFQTHEVIGSSLLFVHDRTQASIWLIDFAKTVSLPNGSCITHINEWIVGNHEDGYLIGINNLIQIFEELLADNNMELQQQQQVRAIEANDEKEADNVYNDHHHEEGDDDVVQLRATSNQIDCTSEKGTATSEMQNMNLPIDAMKIDQQIANSDGVEEK